MLYNIYNQTVSNTQQLIDNFTPFTVVTTVGSMMEKIIKGDYTDIVRYIMTAIVIWLTATRVFSLITSITFEMIKYIIKFTFQILLYIITYPCRMVKSICTKPKICNTCREYIEHQDIKVYTPCCKTYHHESCWIKNCKLNNHLLNCLCCKTPIVDENLLKYNMKAGLESLRTKQQ